VLILDTDHFSALTRGTDLGKQLLNRLAGVEVPFATTIITIEEGFRGWSAEIARARKPAARIRAYSSLSEFVQTISNWRVLPWTIEAENEFTSLQALKLGIGTMDLRIAAIAMANDATLLSRNLRDFERVAGLKTENWLDV
jgi:tRNA(fMet)-specific endonuclease VapC